MFDASRLELKDECKEMALLLCPKLPHAVPIFLLSRITPYYPAEYIKLISKKHPTVNGAIKSFPFFLINQLLS